MCSKTVRDNDNVKDFITEIQTRISKQMVNTTERAAALMPGWLYIRHVQGEAVQTLKIAGQGCENTVLPNRSRQKMCLVLDPK